MISPEVIRDDLNNAIKQNYVQLSQRSEKGPTLRSGFDRRGGDVTGGGVVSVRTSPQGEPGLIATLEDYGSFAHMLVHDHQGKTVLDQRVEPALGKVKTSREFRLPAPTADEGKVENVVFAATFEVSPTKQK